MSTASVATEQKFTNLRKRLDQLGYRQPLGIESLPLVERLFSDLVHTTDSLKKSKLELSKTPQNQESFEAQIEPYKSDNAKLVKENNELHQKLIKQKEEADSSIRDLKASLRKIEHENADLKFLNNQYIHKIRALEKESKSKTDKILTLQEKNFHAVVQTPGGRKKNIPFRRQRMEIDSEVPPPERLLSPPIPNPEDPYIADLLKVADDNIGKLREEVQVLISERDGLENKLKGFRQQVETRDAEIDRLTGLLEGGRPYDVVALETRNRSNERLISHLNIQIDYLQQKNNDLQRQADEALTAARGAAENNYGLGSRNAALETELKDVDRLAARLQMDKDTAIKAADREILEAKSELNKSRKELTTMDYEIAQWKASNSRTANENQNMKSQVSILEADKQRLEDLLNKVQDDKRKLSNRINKLVANERELVLEIDRLKHRNGMTAKKKGKSKELDNFLKGIEEERDYWKGEVEVLQQMIKLSSGGSRSRSRSASPNRSRSRATSPKKNKSRNASPIMSPKNGTKSTSHLEAVIKLLEEERDHFKRECDVLKTLRSRPSSPTRLNLSQSKSDDNELLKVQLERDELQRLLDKFERHMAEIQTNVKVLTTERDQVNGMYEETKEELTRLRREVVKSPKSPKTSLAAQAVLRRVENERDDAIADLRRMTTERDTLRERLKIATETALADRARLDQKIEDLENAIHTVERERNDLDDKIRVLQRIVDSHEDQVKDLEVRLITTQDEAQANKATANQMRLLAEQAERSLESSQQVLSRKELDLRGTDEKCLVLEGRMAELQRAAVADRDEINRLKSAVSSVDREKDGLQMSVDDKAERLVQLGEEIRGKDRSISDLRITIADIEASLNRAKETISMKDHEVTSLRRQLDGTSEELTETGRGREVALRENRRLQDDLATMTRENQKLNQELQDTINDSEDLKNQVQDYVVEVKRVEDLLSSKENERTDLLDQYRTLSLEAERYETQSHQLESEGSNLRLELMTKESELRRCQERIGSLERDVDEQMNVSRQYEYQVSSLTSSVANLEEKLRALESEKHSILMDLSAVRDLCTRLEATKDSLQRQLTTKTLDHEKMQSLLDDMKTETDLLRDQVSTEKVSVKNLEGLLQSNRETQFMTQMTAQEKEAELQLYKDRLALNESKVDSQNREIQNLRARTIEYESEIDRIKRSLTNERFERERAVQELRRNGITPPGEGRLSRIGASSPAMRSLSPSRRSASPYRSTYDTDPLTTA